ncbi:chemotaxis protein CheW [Aquitalea sp. LB_tupeE]|uniref:chemotaxis protein CheW n=1 Tax=Aquitalea sp. LB_tupeE TaxID=2748078 RepID=UPI0015B97B54|nr:chemotaxis protein CheW [Aquitalea sp. LB_tupeE]NWK77040.1 purine-binding chemotaxis protein CheW [Aquitalea sp. LB_tupeE]
MTETPASPDSQYLCFQLGTQYFACNILQVREILQYQRPTTIPQMPGFIHGVMNLRGSVLPVIDLAQRLGHGAGRVLRRSCIVIVETAASRGQVLGLLVDAVHEVITLPVTNIMPPPPFGNPIRPDFISGMVMQGERHILLLNMEQVLSLEEMIALAKPGLCQIKAAITGAVN